MIDLSGSERLDRAVEEMADIMDRYGVVFVLNPSEGYKTLCVVLVEDVEDDGESYRVH